MNRRLEENGLSKPRLNSVFQFVLMIFKKSPLAVGARGVVVIVVGNGHGDTSSNPGPD